MQNLKEKELPKIFVAYCDENSFRGLSQALEGVANVEKLTNKIAPSLKQEPAIVIGCKDVERIFKLFDFVKAFDRAIIKIALIEKNDLYSIVKGVNDGIVDAILLFPIDNEKEFRDFISSKIKQHYEFKERDRNITRLKASEQFFHSLFNSINDPLLVVDENLRIVDYNRKAKIELSKQVEDEELYGKHCYEVFNCKVENYDEECIAYKTFKYGKTLVDEKYAEYEDKILLVSSFPFYEGDDFFSDSNRKVILHLRDVTARRQLRQAQKMESIGKLVSGISHEFNNVLGAILPNLELVKEKLPEEAYEVVKDNLSIIEMAVNKARDITQNLLSFARTRGKEKRTKSLVDINQSINNIVSILKPSFPKNISFDLQLAPNLPPVKGYKGELEQVFLNLFINAKDAMEKTGGVITVKTSLVKLDEEFCKRFIRLTPGEYVKIEVKDTGVGIPKEYVDRIFEPFFSTKGVGKGTGLGLSVVYNIIDNHNGQIVVRSVQNKGTIFFIYLPVADAVEVEESLSIRTNGEVSKTEDVKDRGMEEKKQKRILVIDDDQLVLRITKEALEYLGYEVYDIQKPLDAIDLIKNFDDDNSILALIDYAMPDINGVDLFSKMRSIKPNIKAVLISGNIDQKELDRAMSIGFVDFLKKPFSIDELKKTLQNI